MIDFGQPDRAAILADTPEQRLEVKRRQALEYLGDRWLCHYSKRQTREGYREQLKSTSSEKKF